MKEEKAYPVSTAYALNLINDMMELQSGKCTHSDTGKGEIHFTTQMYGTRYAYSFTVRKTADGCLVSLELDEQDAPEQVFRAFALLESLMKGHAGIVT